MIQKANIEKMPLSMCEEVAPGGWRIIMSKASCCSEGIVFTALMFFRRELRPIQRSIWSGVTYQKKLPSLARVLLSGQLTKQP